MYDQRSRSQEQEGVSVGPINFWMTWSRDLISGAQVCLQNTTRSCMALRRTLLGICKWYWTPHHWHQTQQTHHSDAWWHVEQSLSALSTRLHWWPIAASMVRVLPISTASVAQSHPSRAVRYWGQPTSENSLSRQNERKTLRSTHLPCRCTVCLEQSTTTFTQRWH